MSTSPEFVEYLCEQLEGTGAVRYRKMFGEYMVYLNDKPVLLVCGATPFVKMLPYVVTLLVLIVVSLRRSKESQPPASLGLAYFREDR